MTNYRADGWIGDKYDDEVVCPACETFVDLSEDETCEGCGFAGEDTEWDPPEREGRYRMADDRQSSEWWMA